MAIDTPLWLRNAVIYEIFPRNHTEDGTFRSIVSDLTRIKNLGVDIIWLMPFHEIGEVGRKGTLGSPYAIRDYFSIDESLGTLKDLRMLIDRAHKLGMKVIMDIVFHHTSNDSVLWNEHPEWFMLDDDGRPIRKVEDWSDIIDLDFRNKELWEYLIDVLEYWVKQGIDGFRCDIASMIPLDFWIYARNRLKKLNREIIWLGEAIEPNFVKWLRKRGYIAHSAPELHSAFDITYDYDSRELLKEYLNGKIGLSEYLRIFYIQETFYPEHYIKLRFLENHDVPRAAYLFPCIHMLQNWTVFSIMLKGAYLVYAGQEYRISKQTSLFDKDPIDWSSGDKNFQPFLTKLIKIKKKYLLNCYDFEVYSPVNGVAIIRWSCKDYDIIVIANLEQKAGKIEMEIKGVDLISGDIVKSKKGKLELSHRPRIVLIKR